MSELSNFLAMSSRVLKEISDLLIEIERKDDEIAILKKEMEYLRTVLREANRMLDKYRSV